MGACGGGGGAYPHAKKKWAQWSFGERFSAPHRPRYRTRGRIRFVPSGLPPPDPEPRSLRSSSEKCAAKANEKSWLGSDIWATCYGIKLESGDLQRFFMINEIDHVSKKKWGTTPKRCNVEWIHMRLQQTGRQRFVDWEHDNWWWEKGRYG